MQSMAALRLRQGRAADAAGYATDALAIREAADGIHSSGTINSLALLVRALVADGRSAEAKQRLVPAHDAVAAARARGDRAWLLAYRDALAFAGEHERKSDLEALLLALPGPATAPAR